MMPMMSRSNVAPLDAEDVDTSALSRSAMMTNAIRHAAGRGPMAMPEIEDMGDMGDTEEAEMSGGRFAAAQALVEAGDPREAVRMLLIDEEPDELASHAAMQILCDELGAAPLNGPGYEPVAAILSLSASPDPSARESAACTLLMLDGPGDAHNAGTLLGAEGAELHALVNTFRQRAGFQPLIWAEGETALA
jgi:hypothetical protein